MPALGIAKVSVDSFLLSSHLRCISDILIVEPELLTIVHTWFFLLELLKVKGTVEGLHTRVVTVADCGLLFAFIVAAPSYAVAVIVFVVTPEAATLYMPLQDVKSPGMMMGLAREQSKVMGERLEVTA